MQNDMPTIQDAIKQAEKKLAFSNVARLEAQSLLAHVLKVDKSYVLAWPEYPLKQEEIVLFNHYIDRRSKGEPFAYILGYKEFWSLDFIVTKATLIPRPETELLVELTLKLLPIHRKCNVADLGTGSGAIACALAYERRDWTLFAVDCSAESLKVAEQNSRKFNLKNVQIFQGEWCKALPSCKLDAIVSNPPYLSGDDPHLRNSNLCELRFEPRHALVAGNDTDALSDIRIIIHEAKSYLKPEGYLLLEHGLHQGESIRCEMKKAGYVEITEYADLAGIDRVTVAKL